MNFTVVVTERAAADLNDATAWWARERSSEQALRWYTEIRRSIESLSRHPQRCGLAAEAQKFPYELRELHFGLRSPPTHRILFTIAEATVIVLNIRHVSERPIDPPGS